LEFKIVIWKFPDSAHVVIPKKSSTFYW